MAVLERWLRAAVVGLAGLSAAAAAPAPPRYTQSADAFVAVEGERALLTGYREGLEAWAYPLQILTDYRVRFRVPGQVASLDGAPLLRRVERHATGAVRVYIGPDFVVRELLFVPRQKAGAIIAYEVEGRPDVKIEVAFRPSLDLMWPGALGGQSVGWDARASGYVEREPLHGFSATIASAEAIEHDTTRNAARRPDDTLAIVLQPRATGNGPRTATLVIAADPTGTAPPDAPALAASEPELRREAGEHARGVLAGSLRITTPDEAVNRAIASATLALDHAWACGPGIGCGVVAGYGPSRPGRRPQYAWFFAGDGLVAMRAMLDAEQYARAREELAFVTRYRNTKTGMIWHEMSQSAPLIDWANKYPYMFVHVDITFQYLAAVQAYVEATGDTAWAHDNWPALGAAWRYCTSLIDPATGLPTIPPGKQGQNEQDALHDDIRLSSAWIEAADGFARLARTTGHVAQATDAQHRAARARASIARDGWDAAGGFWLSGHTLGGAPVHSEHSDALGVLDQRVFAPQQTGAVLDRIASPEFATDWGLRNLSARATGYDPNLYGAGSVWALGTSGAAVTLWHQHRPLAAEGLWRGLIAWDTLDSAGHIHELMAGDLFHPEVESVPEQTWSSAGVIQSTVEGLLGIEVHAAEHRVRFAPHLPARWDVVAVEGLRVGASILELRIARDGNGMTLGLDNAGPDVTVEFAPAIPLGATPGAASVNGVSTPVVMEANAQDNHAGLRVTARRGRTEVRIAYEGGVEIGPDEVPLALGDPSLRPKIVRAAWIDAGLAIEAWVASPEHDYVDLVTALQPTRTEGGRVERIAERAYRVHLTTTADCCAYRPVHALIGFAR